MILARNRRLPFLALGRLEHLLGLVIRRIVAESRLLHRKQGRQGDTLDERRTSLAELPSPAPKRWLRLWKSGLGVVGRSAVGRDVSINSSLGFRGLAVLGRRSGRGRVIEGRGREGADDGTLRRRRLAREEGQELLGGLFAGGKVSSHIEEKTEKPTDLRVEIVGGFEF